VNLRSIAHALRFSATASGFEERFVYERLMAAYVPLAKRRDLKPPAYLRLETQERFPRLLVSDRSGDRTSLYGPFADRRTAAKAKDALNKRFALRPCDFVFEPDPALPLGLGCVYAQVRSCAAPCLSRVSEEGYRATAAGVAAALASSPRLEAGLPELPAWIARATARALAVERVADAIQVFPIRDGSLIDSEVVTVSENELERALEALSFAVPDGASDDTPWLLSWLRGKRKGVYLVVPDEGSRSGSELANAARSALAEAASGSRSAS
jgi:excinuclease UvrABC nuclease subunit